MDHKAKRPGPPQDRGGAGPRGGGDQVNLSCARTAGIRALLLVLAPATLTAAPPQAFALLTRYPLVLSALVAATLLVAGLGHRVGGVGMRAAATLAFLGWTCGTVLEHQSDPARGLIVLLGAVAFVTFVWPSERLRRFGAENRPADTGQDLLVASGVAAVFGFDTWHLSTSLSALESLMLTVTYLTPAVLVGQRQRFRVGWRKGVLALAMVVAWIPAAVALAARFEYDLQIIPLGLFSPIMTCAVVVQRVALRWMKPATIPTEPGLFEVVLMHPSRAMVLSFLGICTLGTFLLGLPVASASGQALSWLDAVFTAVSATCVTGLIVVDTPTAFSAFGQVVVLGLIQIGGLGIMVFSAAAIVLLGKRLSLSHERVAVDMVGASGRSGLARGIREVLIVTFVTETTAALLLFFGFLMHGDGVGMAAWRAVFTAISAFCNAGFALQSDSLIPYADSPYLIAVIGVTIVVAGLGPAVVAAMVHWRDPLRRSLHARLVLWTTAVLVVVPAIMVTALEWNGTLGTMTFVDKVFNGTFQSITLRTAGFNSIDLAQVHPATWTIMVLTMYVGGSPGSTAGGVKTTTIAIILLAVAAIVRGRARVECFGRTLPTATVLRAAAIATFGTLGCGVALVALQITQTIPLDVVIFEVVSALATVGLSTGGTGALDEVGKIIIITCMFAGRVGTLTLFMSFVSSTREHLTRRYPEEPVPTG